MGTEEIRSFPTIPGGVGLDAVPADLTAYVAFVERRALVRLAGRGRRQVLGRVPAHPRLRRRLGGAGGDPAAGADRDTHREVPALQDYLVRRIFSAAGQRKLPVHIHSSMGVPPFLRTMEADVRNLEPVLTDVRYFDTQFVLIHGGNPLVEYGAYLSLKSHVWYDMSAMTFLYPVPDLAGVLRKVLIYAPEKLLFSTDAAAYPGIPVGAEVQHVALCRSSREARPRSGGAGPRQGGRHGRRGAHGEGPAKCRALRMVVRAPR